MRALAARDWDEKCAAHLVVRTSWGATPDRIASAHRMQLPALLAELTAAQPALNSGSWPEKFDENRGETFRGIRDSRDEGARRDMMREKRREEERLMREIRGWWLREMSVTKSPLREQMALFWHGHFVSSFQKVRSGRLMWKQNQLFRAHALGSIRALATAVVGDPAMMRYLDLARNRASGPNENFARELFELFLLGEGNYSEEDIREAARAFTGYMPDPVTGEVRFLPRMHDSGTKKIFGQRGNFNGRDVVLLAMQQPSCAPFLAGKIWHFFSGREATSAMARVMGNELRKQDFDTAAFLRAMLGCQDFYSQEVVRKSIKSPVHWMVGTSRLLDMPLNGDEREQFALNLLGQNLFVPPNVRGWEGGAAWINTTTLPARNELAARLFAGAPEQQNHLQQLFPEAGRGDVEQLFSAAARRLFPVGLSEKEKERLREAWSASLPQTNPRQRFSPADVTKLVSLLLASPEYQIT